MQNEELEREPLNEYEYSAPPLKEPLEKLAALEIPTPNNPPWGSLAAVGVWFLSVVAIFVFPALFIVPYILMNNQRGIETFQADNTAILLNLAGIGPAHLFTLAVAWFVVTRNGKFSLHDTLGFESGGFRWWNYPIFLIAFFSIAGVVGYFVPEGDNDLLRILRSSRAAVYITVVLATFTAPLVEEIVYRGVLYSALQRSVGVTGAVVIVTALFAGVHFMQYWGSPGTIFLICLLSLALTLIRVKSNNILPCVIMHTIFNGLQSAGLLLEPYLPKATPAVPETTAALIGFFT